VRKLFSILFVAVLSVSLYGQTTKYFNVYLRSNFGIDTMWDGLEVPIYSMNPALSAEPKLPARTLYCNEGDSVVINALSIAQGEHHTIHLHGLDVDTRNDGDPMTSFWLEHMQDTTYSFKATHAGTYIYHCHVADVVHVQMGMYGLIVVKAAGGVNTAWTGGPAYDKAVNWLTSELDSAWHMNVPPHDPINDTVNIPPYKPTYFLVNGKSEWQLDNNDSVKISGAAGQTIYLRLANIGFYNNMIVLPSSLNPQIIDSDGRPLPAILSEDTVYVQPGERFGVLLSPTAVMTDSVPIHFVNMNTGLTENTQWVPLNISNAIGMEESDLQAKDFGVFPVPSVSKVFIENRKNIEISKIIVRDINGKQISAQSFSPYGISISDLSSGVYILEVQTEKGNLFYKIVRG
jgi:hypothetical protein